MVAPLLLPQPPIPTVPSLGAAPSSSSIGESLGPWSTQAIEGGARWLQDGLQRLAKVASANGGEQKQPRPSENSTGEANFGQLPHTLDIEEPTKKKIWPGHLPRNGLPFLYRDALQISGETLADLRKHHFMGMSFQTAREYESKENAIPLGGVKLYVDKIKNIPLALTSSKLHLGPSVGKSIRDNYDLLLSRRKVAVLMTGKEADLLFEHVMPSPGMERDAAVHLYNLFTALSPQTRLLHRQTGQLATDGQGHALWLSPAEVALALLPQNIDLDSAGLLELVRNKASTYRRQVPFLKDLARAVVEVLNHRDFSENIGLEAKANRLRRQEWSTYQKFFRSAGATLSLEEMRAFYNESNSLGKTGAKRTDPDALYKRAYHKLVIHPSLRRRPLVLKTARRPTGAERFYRLGQLYWKLTEKEQEVLLLDALNLTARDIANILGNTSPKAPDTVESILQNARIKIRKYVAHPEDLGLFQGEDVNRYGTDVQIERELGPLFHQLSREELQAYVVLQNSKKTRMGKWSIPRSIRSSPKIMKFISDPAATESLLHKVSEMQAELEKVFTPPLRLWVPPYPGWPLSSKPPLTKKMLPTDSQLRAYFEGGEYVLITPKERELLFLSEVYQSSPKELASLLGLQVGTVKSTLSDARRKLGDIPKMQMPKKSNG